MVEAAFERCADKEHRSMESLASTFRSVPFEPYAPIRRQLLNLLRAVNKVRAAAGYDPVPAEILRLRRRIVAPLIETVHVWPSSSGEVDASHQERHET